MTRTTGRQDNPSTDRTKSIYQRMMAGWVMDLLSADEERPEWSDPNPLDDYRDRNWHRMYTGSVLDD